MGKKQSKRYREALEKVPAGTVAIREGVDIVKGFGANKFDATVELVMHLGIDPKQADQGIRGSISLPHGIGATRNVVAFCEEGDVDAAKQAGAIEAGGDELIKKIQDGWMDFDIAVSTPSMMKKVSRLGRLLGPQGKMPSPKAGTVTDNVVQAVGDYSAGKVEYRNDEGGNVHIPVGKVSFEPDKLTENIEAFVTHVKRIRPPTVKGAYIKKISLSATMSPSVGLEVA
ncbi:MAG: 50S ribosomal protein L1 [Phycisphaerae bacterium]|nr:50S ribosomal protein L1 [Phycisphaerae bacterium]